MPVAQEKVAADIKAIYSPLPGLILEVKVKVGDQIKQGQDVIIMEAMKMENHIASGMSGTVKELMVKNGDSIPEGQLLMVLE